MGAVIWDLSQGLPSETSVGGTIGIAQSLTPKEVIDLNVDCDIRHVVQRDSLAFETEVQAAELMMTRPQAFFAQPLDCIFGASGTGEHVTDFSVISTPDEKKKNVLQQLEAYLHGLTGTRSIRDDAMMAADELYTNGAKNGAPIIGPYDPQDIRPGRIEFVARADKKRLVLGCIDSYGELEIPSITKKIQTCFNEGVARSINQNLQGGAGIGSFMVFNASISLYIGVQTNVKTIVLCALPLSMRLRETFNLPKNIHTLKCE